MIFAPDFQTILPGLFHWSVYDPKVKCDLTSHAWQSDQGIIFFDPTALSHDSLQQLIGNAPPYAILLTNSNHARSSEWYKQQLSIPIIAPKSSIDELDIIPDYTLEDFPIPPSIQAIPLDGGPKGETAYYIPTHKILILGDAIIHLPQTGLAFLPEKYCISHHQLLISAQTLLPLSPQYLCFAHGYPIVHQAQERLHHLLTNP
jgi:glyoxylase-like metal-dependent hydrolase (beta-lactamase superfamily II)